MKILYAARMCRYDLLRSTCALASMVTKWTPTCDKKLHTLVSYTHYYLALRLVAWVGDHLKDMSVKLFSDADFAGDLQTSRSTTGVFLQLSGANTFFPLAGHSKKQSCVSHSTPEAELVAADLAIRSEVLPGPQIWGKLMGCETQLEFEEDKQPAIRIMEAAGC